MNVFILATCRNPDLADATLMVFDTLRVGFPTWPVKVFINEPGPEPMDPACKAALLAACDKVGANTVEGLKTIHHEWIESLLETGMEPFVLCDTDVMFWASVEGFSFPGAAPLAGRLIPQHRCEFTKCVTRSRLHTSLLFVDPVMVRAMVAEYRSQFPITPFNPGLGLIHPVYHPLNGRSYFHDTASLLHHAIGGICFNEDVLNCYDHLHFGTIADIVLPHLTDGPSMAVARTKAFKWPRLAQGCWKVQDAYYAKRADNT